MTLTEHLQVFMGGVAYATWWCLGSFLAARSALAMFAVLAMLTGLSYATVWLGLPPPPDLPLGWSALAIAIQWALFAWWYLSVRRIGRSAWLSKGGVEAQFVTGADTGRIQSCSRESALERLLFGGASVARRTGHWLLATAFLLAIELVVAGAILNAEPATLRGVLHASLLLLWGGMIVLTTMAATAMRPLWLAAGLSRAGLFNLTERRLWKMATALSGAGALFLVLLRMNENLRPDSTLAFCLCTLAAGMLISVYAALAASRSWPLLAAGLGSLLAVLAHQTYLNAVFRADGDDNWWWLGAAAITIACLRMLARRRWVFADMPRA